MKHTDKAPERIVVKVGTSSLVNDSGSLDRAKMRTLVDQISRVKRRKKDVVLVTSGAIRAGMEKLGLETRPKTMPEKQAVAAAGQSLLMTLYTELFAEYKTAAAQVLMTRDDFRDRVRYLNARHTIYTLLRFGCVPVVNENDTVATDEIRFGDNDSLSALVAACVDADLLILLSDVDGLYDSDPRVSDNYGLIEEVARITPEIEALAGGTHGLCGTGGMRTKIEAAKIATSSGIGMVIANAARPNCVLDAVDGKSVGTKFLGRSVSLNHRKRWIAFCSRVKGSIVINEGARKMVVERGKSLLAAGIVSCSGNFGVGDLVAVMDEKSRRIARGLTNYNANEVKLIRGKHSCEIEDILGHKDFDEVIHRDNLVLGV